MLFCFFQVLYQHTNLIFLVKHVHAALFLIPQTADKVTAPHTDWA